MFPLLSGLLGIALYAGATIALITGLRRRQDTLRTALALAITAWICHTLVLQERLLSAAGLHTGLFNTLILAAWVIVLILLVLAFARPVLNLGIGIFPLAALTLAGGVISTDPGPVITPAGAGMSAHIVVSIAAYAVLSLAAMQALVLAVQHRMLHEHHPVAALRALPSLASMEQLLLRMILIGFLLLTVALGSGFLHLEDLFGQQVAHKTVLSIVAWLLFGTLLGGHFLFGWRGLTAVRFTLGGMALLALGYFGSKVVLELILQRG